ncbi:MAG: hypothetical protein WDM78_21685 [Puia sp.]
MLEIITRSKISLPPATNFMLKNGTRTKNAYQINDFFEYHGAYLNRSAGHETAELSLHCMKKNFAELLPVISELIADSIFPEEELEIYKKNMQQRLQVNLRKNDFIADGSSILTCLVRTIPMADTVLWKTIQHFTSEW